MRLLKTTIGLVFLALAFTSCSEEKSLQAYLVDRQEDPNFVKFDVPASLITEDNSFLNQEQKEVLATVHKLNIMAYPIKSGDSVQAQADYLAQKDIIKGILDQQKYQTLIKFGSPTQGASLKFVGETDAIDELIIFASDEERGFAVFRLTGDKMDPEKMINMMKDIENGDLDLQQMNGFGNLFDEGDGDYDESWENEEGWPDDVAEKQSKVDSILAEIED